jgi:hypothetical protein
MNLLCASIFSDHLSVKAIIAKHKRKKITENMVTSLAINLFSIAASIKILIVFK